MNAVEIIFWVSILLVFHTHLGYGIILFFLVRLKRIFKWGKREVIPGYEPHVTLMVAAYNEKDYVDQKVRNARELDYPAEKLHQVWITDGSDDGTPELLRKYEDVTLYHEDARRGKIAAMNRGMKLVDTPIVVFSDANTLLGERSIREIVNLFADPRVGCISGEKRVFSGEKDTAAGSGESLYWKYESTLKKWEGELYSVVAAAGELFAVRTELYEEVEHDTLLDDFIISLRIAMKGYTIQYNPEAYAIETASASVKEELKRKIRISAGGIQSVVRLRPLLNIFRYGFLSFMYISHKALRWTLAPLSLLIIMFTNIALVVFPSGLWLNPLVYLLLLAGQVLFYLAALAGWILENRKLKVKLLFVPYYFFIMNYSVYLGFFRYLKGKQSVNWERAKRA